MNFALNNSFADIKECKSGDKDPCHRKAECIEKDPGYECKCKQGYTGNGIECQGNSFPSFPIELS